MGAALSGTGPALRSFYLQLSFVLLQQTSSRLRLYFEARTTYVSPPVAPSCPIGSIYASPPALAPPVQPLALDVPAPPAFQACFRVVSLVLLSRKDARKLRASKNKSRNRKSVLGARPGC